MSVGGSEIQPTGQNPVDELILMHTSQELMKELEKVQPSHLMNTNSPIKAKPLSSIIGS
jgi:hypothetical protein